MTWSACRELKERLREDRCVESMVLEVLEETQEVLGGVMEGELCLRGSLLMRIVLGATELEVSKILGGETWGITGNLWGKE